MAAPPAALAPPAVSLLRETVDWLTGSDMDDVTTSGAAALSSVMLTAPTASNAAQLYGEVHKIAAALDNTMGGGIPGGVGSSLSRTPFACARIPFTAPSPSSVVEGSMDVAMGLWAGGSERLLPSTLLLDVELVQLRAWRYFISALELFYEGA